MVIFSDIRLQGKHIIQCNQVEPLLANFLQISETVLQENSSIKNHE